MHDHIIDSANLVLFTLSQIEEKFSSSSRARNSQEIKDIKDKLQFYWAKFKNEYSNAVFIERLQFEFNEINIIVLKILGWTAYSNPEHECSNVVMNAQINLSKIISSMINQKKKIENDQNLNQEKDDEEKTMTSYVVLTEFGIFYVEADDYEIDEDRITFLREEFHIAVFNKFKAVYDRNFVNQ